MQRKIEITNEDTMNMDGAPDTAPDGMPPDLGDHVNPAESTAPEAVHSGGRADAPSDSGSGASAYIIALQADLEEARRLKEEADKRLVYTQAEFQNFRRRKEEESKDLQRFGNSEMIQALFPVVDNFERALSAAEKTKNFDALVGGVSGTLKQLQTFLQKAGVTPIEALGKEFDPNFHEAIGHTESSEYGANKVAEEVQRGYMLHDRVLRPTLVKVSNG